MQFELSSFKKNDYDKIKESSKKKLPRFSIFELPSEEYLHYFTLLLYNYLSYFSKEKAFYKNKYDIYYKKSFKNKYKSKFININVKINFIKISKEEYKLDNNHIMEEHY